MANIFSAVLFKKTLYISLDNITIYLYKTFWADELQSEGFPDYINFMY